MANENQTRGKPAGKCIECGKQVWYPTTLFCKECAIEFYKEISEKLEGDE